ncbi:MAG: VWA domain-containing protein [Planctomycetes bacterium]|nr:VWA domain-containing protein [Planctomycetota bacterium]
MNRVPFLFPLFACAAVSAQAPAIPAKAPVTVVAAPLVGKPAAPRPIDLCICLDISGSMDGLINAARQNLWSVVNELATLQPTPTLRVALLTFGCDAHDAQKGWVKVETGFTTDLDTVSQKLFALATNGGNEYVGRVVQTALAELEWSQQGEGLQLLFVCGNESAQQDKEVDNAVVCKAAIGKGIVVNSIYCGADTDAIATAWRDVARLADGQYAAIEKDTAVVITTPFDAQLAELSTALNTTYVAYGAQRDMWVGNQVAQDGNASTLNPAAAAQRCQTKASGLYSNAHWDLVDASDDAKFKLEEVKKEDLPEALRALSLADLRTHVAAQRAKRKELQAKVAEVGKQRDAFVLAEQKKLGAARDTQFEKVVLEAVRQQAAARGFTRKAEPAAERDPRFVPIVEEAAKQYRSFVRVTGGPRQAPTDCRIRPPFVRLSEAEKEHGQKLYLLYARQAEGLEYVTKGEPAKLGQTLVKESWTCVDGEPTGPTEASARHFGPLVLHEGVRTCHAGDFHGLFVMHKLDPATEGTDQGWIYGTVDRTGTVTAAGRIGSCMKCHQDTAEDRRFGLR